MKRLIISLVAVLCFGLVVESQAVAAQVQWKVEDGGNGHWYEAILADQPVGYVGQWDYSGGITWAEARDAAMAKGGWLVDIHSAAENDFVFGLVTPSMWFSESTTGSPLGPWLGGFQPTGSPEPGGNWQWATSDPMTYTNWGACLDNGYLGPLLPGHNRSEDAMHFVYNAPIWNDIPSWTVTNGYVMEHVPEPSSFILFAIAGFSIIIYACRRNQPPMAK